MDGGLLGLAEPAAEMGISMVPCSLWECVYVCESVCICIRWIQFTISPHIQWSNEYCICPCVLVYIQDVTHMHVCIYVCYAQSQPLRFEAFRVSPAVISEVQVVLRNGNKTAFLYWYSIDYSVLVASSCHPALSERIFMLIK